jgi:hypothetical protein
MVPLILSLEQAKGASRHPFLDLVNQVSIFVMALKHLVFTPKAFVNGVEHVLPRHLSMVWNMYCDGMHLGEPIPPKTTMGLQL